MRLVEEAWVLWQRLGFRQMAMRCPQEARLLPGYGVRWRRLWRLQDKARGRYYRRKRACGGDW